MNGPVVTVVLAVAGGVIVLLVEYNVFNQGGVEPRNRAEPQMIASLPAENPPAARHQPVPPAPKSLVDLHRTANKISDRYSKTSELRALSAHALSIGEIAYAIVIAKDIPDRYVQASALGDVV